MKTILVLTMYLAACATQGDTGENEQAVRCNDCPIEDDGGGSPIDPNSLTARPAAEAIPPFLATDAPGGLDFYRLNSLKCHGGVGDTIGPWVSCCLTFSTGDRYTDTKVCCSVDNTGARCSRGYIQRWPDPPPPPLPN